MAETQQYFPDCDKDGFVDAVIYGPCARIKAGEIEYLMLAYACLDQAGHGGFAKELLKTIGNAMDEGEYDGR